jgi:hypothetical protein
MLRSIIALALSLFIAAEASAQTTPATAKKAPAKASARQAQRATKKAQRLARKATPAPAVAQATSTDDGWPPIEPVAAVQAPAVAETPVHLRAEDVVYAGPGMAVKVQPSRLLPYSIRPPRKPVSTGTTLAPVAANW